MAVDPNGVDGFYDQQRQGEVQLWDVGSRTARGADDRAGRADPCSPSPSTGTARCSRPAARGQLDLWDVATRARRGKPMRVADDGVLSVAFDPSGRLVAGGGATGPVRVWRVADQRPAFPPLAGHTGPVTGRRPSTRPARSSRPRACSAATRLWDPATGLGYGDELVGSPRPDSLVPTIDLPFLGLRNAFSPDGKLLAVPGVETRAMLWDVDPAVWRERACAIVGRNLSREEWKLYLPSGTPLSRDVLGVAHGLSALVGRGPTLAERSETVPLAQPTSACPGDRAARSVAATLPLTGPRARSGSLDRRCVMRVQLIRVGAIGLAGLAGSLALVGSSAATRTAANVCSPTATILQSPRAASEEVQAKGINDRGDVVGFADANDGRPRSTPSCGRAARPRVQSTSACSPATSPPRPTASTTPASSSASSTTGRNERFRSAGRTGA